MYKYSNADTGVEPKKRIRERDCLTVYSSVCAAPYCSPSPKCSPDLNVAPNMYINVART